MYKYKKEIENLISSVRKSDNDYFKLKKEIKINENNILILKNKINKLNRERNKK